MAEKSILSHLILARYTSKGGKVRREAVQAAATETTHKAERRAVLTSFALQHGCNAPVQHWKRVCRLLLAACHIYGLH